MIYTFHSINSFSVSYNSWSITYGDPTLEEEVLNDSKVLELQNNVQSTADKKVELYSDRIALPTLEGVHFVFVSQIIRLEADKNYTTVHIKNRPTIIVSKTLKEVEKALNPSRFFRIHQSHTIDIQKIDVYRRGRGGSVLLINGDVLPVSKDKKEKLLRLICL